MTNKLKIFLIVIVSFLLSNVKGQSYIGNLEVYENNGVIYNEAGSQDNLVDTKHIIIKYANNVSDNTINSFEISNNLNNKAEYFGYSIYEIPANVSYISYCQALEQSSIVNYIEPSIFFKYSSNDPPNDPEYLNGNQYYLDLMQVIDAWNITTGSSDVIVGVLDTGLEFDIEEFGPVENNISNLYHNPGEDPWFPDWDNPNDGNDENEDNNGIYEDGVLIVPYTDDWIGYDIFEAEASNGEWIYVRDNDVMPSNYPSPISPIGDDTHTWHGTWIAGIIAAKSNNGEEIAGIAGGNIANNIPGAEILPIKMSDYAQTYPPYWWHMGATSVEVIEGIDYAISMGVDILNMSFGVTGSAIQINSVEYALDEAYNSGMVLVAAVGNENEITNISFPASYPKVIAVGATDDDDDYWPDSNEGNSLELMAPGVDITSVDGYGLNGTSYAVPMVCGTIALMKSVNPDLTIAEIREILRLTAYQKDGVLFNQTNSYFDLPNTEWNTSYGFGRINTLEAVCMALDYKGDLTVNTSEDWDTPQFSKNDIYIENGITITLSSTLSMAPDKKVVINPGGKLIVNNGKITNLTYCGNDDEKWKGIEVRGDADATQESTNGNYFQGYLELNGATIENAETAVYLGSLENSDLNGGIIKAENSSFENNTIGVHFPEYHNIKVFEEGGVIIEEIELDNISYFRYCNFLNDENYIEDADFDSHIKLHSVKGIKTKHSIFNSGGRNGIGIDAFDAGFYVSGNCDNPMGCTPEEWEYSSFTGYDKAIYTRNATSPLYSINIYHSIFDNNQYGVFADNLHHVTNIRNSYFYVDKNTDSKEKSLCSEAYGRGIHISNSNNFHIEYNKFFLASGVTSSDNVIGIYAYYNPSDYDVIYSNEFNGFLLGNLAEEINRSVTGDDDKGLVYECNENYNNFIDFEVNGTTQYLAKIHGHQGTEYVSAHNSYSNNSDPNAKHWRNMGAQMINYYVHSSENNTMYKPTKIETYNNGNYFTIVTNSTYENQCPDNDGSHQERTALSPEEIQEEELVYSEAYSDYQAVETIFNDLKDGGSTAGTTLTIANAQADDTWELRANLLGKSPHLSKQVLMEAADRTDVLPNSVLLDVLAANPDELKKVDFIEYLENKEEPLPDYMIDILEDVSTGTTYKTALLNQMNHFKSKQKRAANTILNSLLNEEYQDYNLIRNWLGNLGNLNADMKITETYIQENNYTDANTLLNMIPDLYDLQGDELNKYLDDKDVLFLQITLKQSDRSLKELNTGELTQLENWAINDNGYARAFARNVLETHYGNNSFCDCINRNENKNSFADLAFEEKPDSPLFIEASPNPANHYVEFTYELSEIDQEGVIVITDINGKQIQSFSINYQKGIQAWDIRKIPAGSYIFVLKTKYFEKSGKLIIQ